jgi:hypothetical protein
LIKCCNLCPTQKAEKKNFATCHLFKKEINLYFHQLLSKSRKIAKNDENKIINWTTKKLSFFLESFELLSRSVIKNMKELYEILRNLIAFFFEMGNKLKWKLSWKNF